ncbi:MAG: helix-turn-helix domain-containing protein [Pirellulales bacterium]
MAIEPLALRPVDAAKALGVSLSTFERLVKSGELPYVRINNVRVFSVEALQEWLREKQVYASEE